mgnify:FL=1|tara:strand:+ start:3263 stop:3481 length:219 start_codon:yes stop_codon:yes gene_type:complete
MKEFDIEYNGTIFTIKKDTSESTDVFLQRAWYIVNKSDTSDNFNELIEKSLIWRNNQIYGMVYDQSILSSII